jgi:hypothetical protein
MMAQLIWKKIVATYDGRDITAQYARDGAYVRVSLPGKAEERMKHRKQRAEPLALGLLIQMAAESKNSVSRAMLSTTPRRRPLKD